MGGAVRKISPPAHNSTPNDTTSNAASPNHNLRVLPMSRSPFVHAHMVRARGGRRLDPGQAGKVRPTGSGPQDRRREGFQAAAIGDFEFAAVNVHKIGR